MNPLGGLSAIFEMFAATQAETARKEAALTNMVELDRSAGLEAKNAVAVRQRGSAAAGRKRMEGSAIAGQQRMAYAMGNVASGSGTAAQTQASSAVWNELDATTLRNNAVREAFGHEESARRYATASKKILDRELAPDRAGMSPADAEFSFKLGSSALMSAASFGMGGK